MSTARDDFYATLAASLRSADDWDWRTHARENQLPPEGIWWRIWLLLAGRGFGKTRTIMEFVRMMVEIGLAFRIALVAATAADARDVLVEGPAGILAISPKWNKPTYSPTKRRLDWPNGAVAMTFSADEPERLRGPQHDLAVCDELAAWRYPEALDMLLLGLRLGKNPRVAIATTPRPTKIIRDLLSREGKDVAVTRGSTLENSDNLAPQYVEQIIERYKGTRLERQEVFGELLEDTPGALWTRENLEQTRVAEAPSLQRIVVAIDPGGSGEDGHDETGIVVCGLGQDGHGYVLEDLSGRYAPTDWARRALGAYHVWKADRLVAEQNYGGQMVTSTIESVDPTIPVKAITSSRGKVLRAEPIAAYFAQGRAHMVGSHPELEDQCCRFTADWLRSRDGSPDRVDAMVFALTELMLGQPVGGFFRESSLLVNGEPIDELQRPNHVFAVACSSLKVEAESDGVGVVFFARTKHYGHPLIVLDWDLVQFDGSSPRVSDLRDRLKTLCTETRAIHGSAGIWISPTPIGAALIHQGGDDLYEMPEWEGDLPARAAAAGRFVGAGDVKITRPAHEKLSAFRGVTRNHLLAQVLGFTLGKDPEAGELLEAFVIGVRLALEDR